MHEKNLISTLTKLCSRDCEGHHDKECLILNIVLLCLEADQQLEISQSTLNEFCQILNPLHIVNFSLVLEIYSIICCHQSDEKVHQIALAWMEMKRQNYWNYPIEPFIQLLQTNRSVFAIGSMCRFINYFMEAHADVEYSIKIKKAFVNYGLRLLYQDVKLKIENGQYFIQDCTYEAMDNMLQEQYQKYLKKEFIRKRNLLPPDGKPVELSVCAKLCHELFISPKAANAD